MILSISAHRMWSRCQRQFFIAQLMAHHAAKKDPLRQRAYFLRKRLQQLSWWPGKIVHKAIEDWILPEIKAGRWPNSDQIIHQAQDLAKKQFLFSQAGHYQTIPPEEEDETYFILAQHYFGEQLELDTLDKCIETITKALQYLLNSQTLPDFLMGRKWYQWERSLNFKVDATSMRAVPDLLMPSKTQVGLDIIDWKVATASSNYHFQVALYALAVQGTEWLADYARGGVRGYVINLLDPDPGAALANPYIVDDSVLASTVNAIYEKNEQIEALIQGRKYDQIDIGLFEYANSVGTCALCNWRELCVELGDESPAKSLSDNKSRPTQLELPLG